MTARLTLHQLETLQLYQQLGTVEAVADYRGVQVATIGNTLKICRRKLGVATSREAVLAVPALARLARA